MNTSPFEILARHQAQTPINPQRIANDLGIRVYTAFLGPNVAGKIVRDKAKGGPSGFAIYVNATEHPNRQRFTIAHEIAHYVLHRDLIESGIVDDTMYRSEQMSNVFEAQANRMAADILMPVRLVKAMWPHAAGSVDTMASSFGVSKDAMRIRLEALGLIPKQVR